MSTALSELRVPDLLTFLTVCRLGSVTGAARDLRVTPSSVSKAITRLERQLKRPLLSRTTRGVIVSEEGRKVVPWIEEIVERLRALSTKSEVAPDLKLTLAAPSYLCATFLPTLARAVPDARFRGLECVGAFMRAYATERVFQIALTVGEEKFPESWISTRAGTLRLGLFASPSLARTLGPSPSVAKIKSLPFILPVYNSGGAQILPGNDGCPIPREERLLGHEAATVAVAFELAAATNQLAFGPVSAARTLVRAEQLVEVRVPNWHLTETLYVHTNADVVLARVQKAIVTALRETAREI
jgi:DNA-binding transcriptional LysR family regulator